MFPNFRIDVNEIWRGENPVMAIRVNQMDNGLLAATDFQWVPIFFVRTKSKFFNYHFAIFLVASLRAALCLY